MAGALGRGGVQDLGAGDGSEARLFASEGWVECEVCPGGFDFYTY